MRTKLILILAMGIFCACSGDHDLYFKKEPDLRSIKMARRLSVDFPAVDPEGNFEMVSAKSFKIRPVDVIDQMYGHFGKNVINFENQTNKEIYATINETAKGLGIRNLKIYAALEAGIRVSQSELDSTIQERYKEAKGKEEYMEYLKANEITMEDVILNTRRYLLIEKFEKYIHSKLPPVTEYDIIKAYEEPKTATVRAIFFGTEGKSEKEKKEIRKKAEEVLEKAQKGENFIELVKMYNEDPATQRNAGFYPNFHRGDMQRPIEEAAFSLPIDSISGIIETEDGLHILKILDRVKEPKPLGEVREKIKETIIIQRGKAMTDEIIEKMKERENYRFRKLPL